jgi:hypothetical protein
MAPGGLLARPGEYMLFALNWQALGAAVGNCPSETCARVLAKADQAVPGGA